MAKNKLKDLNDHLYMQLERLGDEDLKGEDLKTEIQRGKVMASVAAQIVGTGRLVLDAETLRCEHRLTGSPLAQLTQDPEPEKQG